MAPWTLFLLGLSGCGGFVVPSQRLARGAALAATTYDAAAPDGAAGSPEDLPPMPMRDTDTFVPDAKGYFRNFLLGAVLSSAMLLVAVTNAPPPPPTAAAVTRTQRRDQRALYVEVALAKMAETPAPVEKPWFFFGQAQPAAAPPAARAPPAAAPAAAKAQPAATVPPVATAPPAATAPPMAKFAPAVPAPPAAKIAPVAAFAPAAPAPRAPPPPKAAPMPKVAAAPKAVVAPVIYDRPQLGAVEQLLGIMLGVSPFAALIAFVLGALAPRAARFQTARMKFLEPQ
ncbi:hypothetical protein M885DRAFT_553011 [Pelagophyceae sp. CCMP2097]|nr:hypothetical protein M885DRAFT_553011 [Pelagophyceae sp. CCMP2097]|mmetsp:Transcript_29103/g.100377  ORF Transcript_29103/g.100377 Transcript_29103/m.100377 type:complete len:286 (-) Transcript_29103:60-917(-)